LPLLSHTTRNKFYWFHLFAFFSLVQDLGRRIFHVIQQVNTFTAVTATAVTATVVHAPPCCCLPPPRRRRPLPPPMSLSRPPPPCRRHTVCRRRTFHVIQQVNTLLLSLLLLLSSMTPSCRLHLLCKLYLYTTPPQVPTKQKFPQAEISNDVALAGCGGRFFIALIFHPDCGSTGIPVYDPRFVLHTYANAMA